MLHLAAVEMALVMLGLLYHTGFQLIAPCTAAAAACGHSTAMTQAGVRWRKLRQIATVDCVTQQQLFRRRVAISGRMSASRSAQAWATSAELGSSPASWLTWQAAVDWLSLAARLGRQRSPATGG